MGKKRIINSVFTLYFMFIGYACAHAQSGQEALNSIRSTFVHPSDSTRTKLWWFHGETETTKEGITADLQAFKHEGVGGVVYYDQVHGNGKGALPAFSKKWWDMFRFAASEAKRLDLTFEANLSNGYVSGGPWISEDLGMQRLVASDTTIEGGGLCNIGLPVPAKDAKYKVFHDVAVLAFPILSGDWATSLSQRAKITTNIADFDASSIFYPKSKGLVRIPYCPSGSSVLLNMAFDDSFTARSITYCARPYGKSRTGAMNIPGLPSDSFFGAGYKKRPALGQLEASKDGITYTKVCDLRPMYESPTWNQITVSFPAIKARYFRIQLHDWCRPDEKPRDIFIGNMVLSSQAKMDNWEVKAALNADYIEKDRTPNYDDSVIIDPSKIVNLTSKVDKNGQLRWDVPPGQWKIMRFAYVPIGVKIKHGRANLMGLESDKLSAKATITQWNNYFKVMQDSLKKVGLSLDGLTMDSHEAGSQNWTPGFAAEFRERRGYDIHPYLPALLGYIVKSKEQTSKFLYDMRLTISDLISENYFGVLDSLCKKAGVNFTAQAVGNGLSIVADNFKAKGRVQKPQGEFWAYQTNGNYDIKETSSAAHVYGKPIASAEAFTDMKFSNSLADMKNLADYAYAAGINEFAVCASAYQPWLNKIPGSTGGGRQYVLNRNNTFWKYSHPFWDYQARCAGMMRQGLPVVDLCVYLGEDPPIKLLAYRLPVIPEGYNFDVCTEDALISRFSSKEGMLHLPNGMNYQMLILEPQADISMDALNKIADLVNKGVTVFGPRPTCSGSLQDARFASQYQKLVNKLWGKEKAGCKAYGRGKVYWGMPLEEVLVKQEIAPDVRLKSGNTITNKVYFAHRQLKDYDIYFFDNHSNQSYNDTIRLRTEAAAAQFWDPVTGRQYALPVMRSGKDGLKLNLILQPHEVGFIVTGKHFSNSVGSRPERIDEQVTKIKGSWNVFFDPNWGGPGEVRFDKLSDWTKNKNEGIKYYSGTAVYQKSLYFDSVNKGQQVLLRFPHLGSIARVFINGHEVSTVWCSPWESDITPFIIKGENELKIQVVNSLTNRMIGDASLPKSARYTNAYPEIASSTDHLVPSGIMDEVLLIKRPE